jgi:hypothetical protein
MIDIYCTYFDHNYLSRAKLMIDSLRRFEPKTHIYILALSELCEATLRELALPDVEIIPLPRLEDAYPELAAAKLTRSTIEYYFTLSPFLPHYLFTQILADRITYIDADLYFFTSPRPVLDSLGGASIAITPHRFSRLYLDRGYMQYGHFNVGWITYRRCPEAMECLKTYKAECLAWCYDRVELDRFADQKYLDSWPLRYPSIKILGHKGFNLGIWNVDNYKLLPKERYSTKEKYVTVDGESLVFYHFSAAKFFPDGSVRIPVDPPFDRSKSVLIKNVIKPYERKLEEMHRSFLERFPSLAMAKSSIRYQA